MDAIELARARWKAAGSACGVALAWAAGAVGASGQTDVDVASLSLDELMQVEVTTPGKVPEAIRDTPASVYLISRSDIETFGYRNLTEVFEHVPGFYNIDNYTGVSGNFGVRGYWNGRSQNSSLAILINGVPQSRADIWANPMELINVPVEAIDRIEVSRGPNSVIYGNGAFFGAINIITDDSFRDDQVAVSYGSLDTRRAAFRWSEFGEDFHVIFNGGMTSTDGLATDLAEMAGPFQRNLLPLFGAAPENTSLDGRLEQEYAMAQLSGAWKWLRFDFSRNEGLIESYSGFPSVEGGNERDLSHTRLTLGAELPMGDALALDTNLTWASHESEEQYDALFPGFEGVNTRDFNTWELESLLTYEPQADLRWILGANLQRMQQFREYTHVPALGLLNEVVDIDERDTWSLFGQVSYDINEALRVVGGYRVEELQRFRRDLYLNNDPLDGPPTVIGYKGDFENGTPRVSLIYQPDQAQVLKLMLGDAIKFPTFPDQELNSEKVRTVEANYSWSSEEVFLSASVFRNTLSDLLIQELEILENFTIDTDLRPGGRVVTHGVEAMARWNLSDSVRGEIGATWQDSDNERHPDGLLGYSPELVGHAKLSYQRESFSAALLGRYVGGMYSYYNANADDSPLLVDGFFGDRVDSYVSVDVNLRWEDLPGGLYVSAHATNLFDEQIRYPNNPINGLLLNRGNIGYGRRLSLKAGIRF